MLTLHTLKPAAGASKERKRVGRGNASGHGNYSGKGNKGQKSRSGVSGLGRMAIKRALLPIPKLRGFKSNKPKYQVVNLADFNRCFKDGDLINPASLVKVGLVSQPEYVKILGQGQLELKNLKLAGLKISESAKQQLTKLGGQLE